jgi:hypothetical protein
MIKITKHLEDDNTAMIYFFVVMILMCVADAILN